MSPRVEKYYPERSRTKFKYFVVVLNTPESLDISSFDRFAMKLNPGRNNNSFYLKWIVKGDNLYIFPALVEHSKMDYDSLEFLGDKGKLQAAGHLEMSFGIEETRRELYGHAVTLYPELPIEDSNRYKTEVLAPKLGQCLRVT